MLKSLSISSTTSGGISVGGFSSSNLASNSSSSNLIPSSSSSSIGLPSSSIAGLSPSGFSPCSYLLSSSNLTIASSRSWDLLSYLSASRSIASCLSSLSLDFCPLLATTSLILSSRAWVIHPYNLPRATEYSLTYSSVAPIPSRLSLTKQSFWYSLYSSSLAPKGQ